MNRTFHHKLSIQAVATVVLLAVCALWCFLVRTGLSPFAGLACMMLGAIAVDRMIHTEYVITDSDQLVISRGRLCKPTAIEIGDIVAVRHVRGMLFVAPHVIVEYGAGRITSVQPAEPDAFIKEIKKRLNSKPTI